MIWKRIIGIVALGLVTVSTLAQSSQEVLRVPTRFGVLTVGEDKILLFKGHPFRPLIQGNDSLDVDKPFSIGATDVVLVTDNGGTACPYLYHWVTVSNAGAKATVAFGTCNSVIKTKRVGDSISLTMAGYAGPFESDAAIGKAAMESHVFVLRNGVVTENGKLVPQ